MTIAIDAGTIESRHFLDIVLLALAFRIRPFLYNSVGQTCLTARDSGTILADQIKDLEAIGVHVASIVGDNLPAQVSGLAHWTRTSILQGRFMPRSNSRAACVTFSSL
jgi:hypothetical protein